MSDMSYKTDVPQAKEFEGWQNKFRFIKVTSLDHFKQIREEYMDAGAPQMAFDTETSSLSIIDLELVGFSFCWDVKKTRTAYYVPVGHIGSGNLPLLPSLEIMDTMLGCSEKILLYNLPFDVRVLRKYGVNVARYRLFDVMSLVWNRDTNIKRISLKAMSLYHVGFKMTTYKELINNLKSGFSQECDFVLTPCDEVVEDEEDGSLDLFPCTQDIVNYACSDVICTNFLFIVMEEFYKQTKFIIDLDSRFEYVKMFLEETDVFFDVELASKIKSDFEDEAERLKDKILSQVGREVNINSSDDLIKAFKKIGIPLTERTKPTKTCPQGNLSLNKHIFAKLASKYPVCAEIVEFRHLSTMLSTYIKKLTECQFGKFRYSTHTNPTGRLQGSGEDKKLKGSSLFMPLNIQNIPKPQGAFYTPKKLSSLEDGVLGWDFELSPEGVTKGVIEAYAPDNIRQVFRPRDGHICLSVDYSGQELVVIANLSRDPAFLDPLSKGESLHKRTAIDMFGEENYNSKNKAVAKAANFNCTYLGNHFSMKQNLPDVPIDECETYFNLWKKSHPHYFSWLETRYQQAIRQGYISTPLGRPRRVAFWFNSSNYKINMHGKKTVSNSPIQGTGGDIIKFVLIRIYNEILCNPIYQGKVYFMMTVHDEVNFSIDKRPEYFYPIANKILEIMVDLPFNKAPFNWPVPLTTGVSVGKTWGSIMPYDVSNPLEWVPKID